MSDPVSIALALVVDGERVLVGRRPATAHLPDRAEFPGGKVEHGESVEQAALRELLEETSVRAVAVGRLSSVCHHYPTRSVWLHPVLCRVVEGEPRALGTEAPRWVPIAELGSLEFPEANRAIVSELQSWATR
jgi:8-oxo-dGTP diphosphatase